MYCRKDLASIYQEDLTDWRIPYWADPLQAYSTLSYALITVTWSTSKIKNGNCEILRPRLSPCHIRSITNFEIQEKFWYWVKAEFNMRKTSYSPSISVHRYPQEGPLKILTKFHFFAIFFFVVVVVYSAIIIEILPRPN